MSDVRKPNSEWAEPGIGAYLVVTEVGKPHSEWAEPGIGRQAESAFFLTNFQSLGGPLKGHPKQQFWIEFRAILWPGPPLGGLEARNYVGVRQNRVPTSLVRGRVCLFWRLYQNQAAYMLGRSAYIQA